MAETFGQLNKASRDWEKAYPGHFLVHFLIFF